MCFGHVLVFFNHCYTQRGVPHHLAWWTTAIVFGCSPPNELVFGQEALTDWTGQDRGNGSMQAQDIGAADLAGAWIASTLHFVPQVRPQLLQQPIFAAR